MSSISDLPTIYHNPIIKDLGMIAEASGRMQHRGIVKCNECKEERETRFSRVKFPFAICRSCQTKKRNFRHGLHSHPLHKVHNTMKQRCTNPNTRMYYRYGERGIKVCEEWQDFLTFYNWAIHNGYKKGLSIDRIDNNGNYEPSNCEWIPLAENIAKNAKLSKNDIKKICHIYINEYTTMTDIAKIFNIDNSRVGQILKENNIKGEYRLVNKNITTKARDIAREKMKKWVNSEKGKKFCSDTGKARRKLTEEQVIEIKLKNNNGQSAYSLAKEYPVSKPTILRIIRNETYKEFTSV